jgi:hypothetical protein
MYWGRGSASEACGSVRTMIGSRQPGTAQITSPAATTGGPMQKKPCFVKKAFYPSIRDPRVRWYLLVLIFCRSSWVELDCNHCSHSLKYSRYSEPAGSSSISRSKIKLEVITSLQSSSETSYGNLCLSEKISQTTVC